MSTTKNDYYTEIKTLLKDNLELLNQFEKLWDSSKYREAYLLIHEKTEGQLNNLTDSYKSVDEQFYWEFIA